MSRAAGRVTPARVSARSMSGARQRCGIEPKARIEISSQYGVDVCVRGACIGISRHAQRGARLVRGRGRMIGVGVGVGRDRQRSAG